METENQEVQAFDGANNVKVIFGYDANGSMVEEHVPVDHPTKPHHNLD